MARRWLIPRRYLPWWCTDDRRGGFSPLDVFKCLRWHARWELEWRWWGLRGALLRWERPVDAARVYDIMGRLNERYPYFGFAPHICHRGHSLELQISWIRVDKPLEPMLFHTVRMSMRRAEGAKGHARIVKALRVLERRYRRELAETAA